MRGVGSIAAAAIAAAWLAACGGSRSEPVVVESAGLKLEAALEPSAGRVGANHLWLELRDERGEPVEGAELEVRVHMHAMGAMPAMGGPSAVTELGGGRYRADFELEMGGTWQVEIRARTPAGKVARAEGSLTVGTPGLRLEGEGAAPAREAREHPAEFQISPERLQRVGIRSAPVVRKEMRTQLRAVGRVAYDETALQDVSLKVAGWVEELRVDALGAPVQRGEVLFTLYSPELYSAQEEYLQALRSQKSARGTSAPDRADYLVRSARNRLRLWGIAKSDLEQIARRGTPLQHLPIRAPASGYVVEKNVVQGSSVEPGQRLYRIAPLDRVWLEAEVYESEIPLVREGQAVSVTLPYRPGHTYEGTVAYVYPSLAADTRTARLRIELPNPDLELRPDMYANVHLVAERGERLVVPLSAVLPVGERSFVFRDLGEGRLRPQEVTVGLRAGEEVEIASGLAEGDRIVVSGTFLVASESRLRAALEQW